MFVYHTVLEIRFYGCYHTCYSAKNNGRVITTDGVRDIKLQRKRFAHTKWMVVSIQKFLRIKILLLNVFNSFLYIEFLIKIFYSKIRSLIN